LAAAFAEDCLPHMKLEDVSIEVIDMDAVVDTITSLHLLDQEQFTVFPNLALQIVSLRVQVIQGKAI
jgi:hypothetical protein